MDPDPESGYTVSVPALSGCFTEGETSEECERNAREAIELYLEDARAVGEAAPPQGDPSSSRCASAKTGVAISTIRSGCCTDR
ncbi:MAG: type II toxin-antitoxin system HicB family antitoxin, partial [Candidatus Dormibacteraeota bacterium]|nr:type II toxin-antitoxin system HicB family antitoxin [Candidatus Dormibacteraeota bacterium]